MKTEKQFWESKLNEAQKELKEAELKCSIASRRLMLFEKGASTENMIHAYQNYKAMQPKEVV